MDAGTLIIVLAIVTLVSGAAFALYQRRAAARAQAENQTSALAQEDDRP